MTVSWRDRPGPARSLGTAISRAVDVTGVLDDYQPAAAELVAQPAHQAGLVLAAITRALLEEQHPDGLDGDDIAAVLSGCVKAASAWLPADRLDPSVLVAVLAGALGVHEPGVTYDEIGVPGPRGGDELDPAFDPTDEVAMRAPSPAEYAWTAPVLIAELLRGRHLNRYLDEAFTEIATAESMELP